MQAYTPQASRVCAARYAAAETAADTALVDRSRPPVSVVGSHETHSCGFTRFAARWQ